ncbi:MAG: hypothetical protein LIP02_00620 [Bacteroidales bacterium]|nr:hypothetical protein [Bacteroidales bacterium]
MRLVDFINEDMRRVASSPVGRKSREKWSLFLKQLEAYIQHSGYEPDVLDLINPDYIYDLCAWLYDDYGKDSNPKTVDKWIEIIWRIARSAIRLGYIPKIDVVRNVRESLAKAHKAKEETDKKSRGPYDLESVDFKAEYQKLVNTVAVMNARTETALDSRSKNALLYLFGLSLGGLEFADIINVECRTEKDEEDFTEFKLYIPRYDISVDFDGVPLVVWKLYHDRQNARPRSGERLFARLTTDDELAFRADVASFCIQNKIEMFRSRSVFCDFLSLVHSCGRTNDDVIHFAKLRTARELTSYDLLILHKFLQTDFDPTALLQADWRLLRVFSLKTKINTVIETIDKLANRSRALGRPSHIQQFAPVQEVVSKRTGKMQRKKVPVFGPYIFVRSRRPEAEMIERTIPDVLFMRQTDNKRRMVTLTNREILRIRSFFSDLRGDESEIDLVDIDQWRKDHAATLDEGRRVRILHGPFEGYDGVIYQIKSTTEDQNPDGLLTTHHSPLTTQVVVVRITPMSNLSIVTLSATIDPLYLQPID